MWQYGTIFFNAHIQFLTRLNATAVFPIATTQARAIASPLIELANAGKKKPNTDMCFLILLHFYCFLLLTFSPYFLTPRCVLARMHLFCFQILCICSAFGKANYALSKLLYMPQFSRLSCYPVPRASTWLMGMLY